MVAESATNLKTLHLTHAFSGVCDLRQVLLELCPNFVHLEFCVDVTQLKVTDLSGIYSTESGIKFVDIIRSQVSQHQP
jgi:hypothetical protein